MSIRQKRHVCKSNTKFNIVIDDQLVEQVSQFRYLDSMLSEDGQSKQEIRSRIARGKKVFMNNS